MIAVDVAEHPLLQLGVLQVEFPTPIGQAPPPTWLTEQLSLRAQAPIAAGDEVRKAVRELLRHGGYKPAGRGKPASEFLVKAATADALSSINLPVDLCNVVSLHSGLPISVVDLDRVVAPVSVRIADDDASYVFNASGQEIRLTGLLCLHDAEGPCANGVKDSQRTKTHEGTTRTLSLIWGTHALAGHTDATLRWYAELHERAGARVLQRKLLP